MGDTVKTLVIKFNDWDNGLIYCPKGTTGVVCDVEHQNDKDPFVYVEADDNEGETDVFDYRPNEIVLATKEEILAEIRKHKS